MNARLETLYNEEQVQERVSEMAAEIDRCYSGQDFTVIALVNGAVFFAVDLLRRLKGSCLFDTLAVSSYVGEHSTGEVRIRGDVKLPLAGRNVLVVDGVLDSGLTLYTVKNHLLRQGVADVKTAVLVSKQCRRHELAQNFRADWVGFEIPDLFVVGCGMDDGELYRNLPYIAIVR